MRGHGDSYNSNGSSITQSELCVRLTVGGANEWNSASSLGFDSWSLATGPPPLLRIIISWPGLIALATPIFVGATSPPMPMPLHRPLSTRFGNPCRTHIRAYEHHQLADRN